MCYSLRVYDSVCQLICLIRTGRIRFHWLWTGYINKHKIVGSCRTSLDWFQTSGSPSKTQNSFMSKAELNYFFVRLKKKKKTYLSRLKKKWRIGPAKWVQSITQCPQQEASLEYIFVSPWKARWQRIFSAHEICIGFPNSVSIPGTAWWNLCS